MKIDNLFAELKRRNVIRFAGLYLVGSWLLVQVASTVLPMFGAPDWLPRSIVILLAIGFLPALIFSWVFEMTPQGLKRDEDVRPEESIAPQTGRRMNRMIIAVLVLALGYFVFDKFVLAPRRAAAPNDSSSGASAKSLAVLPFENLSRDPDNEFFTNGVQDEILSHLSKVADLRVISRTSVMQYKAGAQRNLREIAQQVGVEHVVEGSVQRAANKVRVIAQLIMPDNAETPTNRELYYLCWKSDTRPLHQTIDAILAQGAGAIANAADVWFFCALAERDPAAAERALVALGDAPCWGEASINLSRSFGDGLLARMTRDEARARHVFEA